MEKRRVVITAMGVTSPLGTGIETFWQNLKAGKSGVRPITRFDATGFDSTFAGEVPDYDPADYFNSKEARNLSRFVQLAVVASREAIKGS